MRQGHTFASCRAWRGCGRQATAACPNVAPSMGLVPRPHQMQRPTFEFVTIFRPIRKSFETQPVRIPLVDLRLLSPIAVEAIPNKYEHFRPDQLRHLGICHGKFFALFTPHRD